MFSDKYSYCVNISSRNLIFSFIQRTCIKILMAQFCSLIQFSSVGVCWHLVLRFLKYSTIYTSEYILDPLKYARYTFYLRHHRPSMASLFGCSYKYSDFGLVWSCSLIDKDIIITICDGCRESYRGSVQSCGRSPRSRELWRGQTRPRDRNKKEVSGLNNLFKSIDFNKFICVFAM